MPIIAETPCRFFERGNCRAGEACFWKHGKNDRRNICKECSRVRSASFEMCGTCYQEKRAQRRAREEEEEEERKERERQLAVKASVGAFSGFIQAFKQRTARLQRCSTDKCTGMTDSDLCDDCMETAAMYEKRGRCSGCNEVLTVANSALHFACRSN